MNYLSEVQRGMDYLAKNPSTIFIGQAVEYKGTAITHQVKNYSANQLLEMPVAEDFQAGFCLGLAIHGYIPVCLYPRMNFAILACNQIVNHIDKWPLMSQGKKVIIKAVVGSKTPLDPGHQHKGNYSAAFRGMCETIEVVELVDNRDVFSTYERALDRDDGISTMIIEHGDLYSG
jgi:pyruvate/2-oxoglutarate/acetoin dehydrogenase E1 component